MSSEQGTTHRQFTVRDIPMIRSHGLKRWEGLDDGVKKDVITLIKETVGSDQASQGDKLKAASLAIQIDRLNLKHEEVYTPKLDISLTDLSEADLDAQIAALERLEFFEGVWNTLTSSTDAEMLEETAPMMDCLELPTTSIPLDKYHPREATMQGRAERAYYAKTKKDGVA